MKNLTMVIGQDKAETKWTKEPWYIAPDLNSGHDIGYIGGTCAGKHTSYAVALAHGMTQDERDANADRICECVNKLAGHADLDAVEIVPGCVLQTMLNGLRAYEHKGTGNGCAVCEAITALENILARADRRVHWNGGVAAIDLDVL